VEALIEPAGLSLDLNTLQQGLGILAGTLTIVGGLLAALWAYTKFVLERGLFPPTQFNIDCKAVGRHEGETVLETLLLLKNVGHSTLIAKNIRVDIRCLDVSEKPKLFDDPESKTFGRLVFPLSLKRTLMERHRSSGLVSARAPIAGNATHNTSRETRNVRGMLLLRHHTFVQAGVEQIYTFVTAVPESVVFVLVWASFKYEIQPSPFQKRVLRLSRRIGLVQFSLQHIRKPHTVERVFRVSSAETDNSQRRQR
jgi:hypothetical protein